MKKVYDILLGVLGVVVLLWFLPWLYSIIFPAESADPFVAYSPVSDSFVVSTTGEGARIFTVDSSGLPTTTNLTKNERDSLVPQMYFNQLSGRNALPDSVGGKHIDAATLKNGQWVFNSLPRDINRVQPQVYPIMESRPKRFELEDPTEVFTLEGEVTFIDMATNTINARRSKEFNKVFTDRGFAYPVRSTDADITAKKGYDEGYMLVDGAGKVFHMKMQAGQPYMSKIRMPEDEEATHAFILENPDRRHIALVTTSQGSLYAIEREGYKPVKLPVDNVDPSRQRITIFKNIFNWVIKISDEDSSRWIAIDSDSYTPLGAYHYAREKSKADEIARWIFPCRIIFTDTDSSLAYPRIRDFSAKGLILWIVIATIIYFIYHKKSKR